MPLLSTFAAASVRGLRGVGAPKIAWNPSDKHADITLSNGNRTFTNTVASFRAVRATPILPGVKIYMEFTGGSGGPIFGVATAAASLSNYVGSSTSGWGWQTGSGSKVWHNGSNNAYTGAGDSTSGDTLMIAIDAASQKFWGGRNGTWHNSGNPAAGTGAASFPTTPIPTSSIYLMGSINSLNSLTIRQTPAYTVPSGFTFIGGGS